MTIAIADWRRRGQRNGHAASSVRAKIDDLAGPEIHVLHDVSVGVDDCKIDHLILSPGGVFAVITREEASRDVRVDGYTMTVGDTQVPHLRHSKFVAERASALLTAHADFDVLARGLHPRHQIPGRVLGFPVPRVMQNLWRSEQAAYR